MIALCGPHHDAADQGAFTDGQLREFKKNAREQVSSRFNWRRRHTVFCCGGFYAYNCTSMLRVSGIDIIFFEKDNEGYDTLSLNIFDVHLDKIFAMRQNDWIAWTNVEDIEAPPSARTLRFKSPLRGVDLAIEFKDRRRLNSHEIEISSKLGIPKEANVLFIHFRGEITAPVPAIFAEKQITLPSTIIKGGITVGSDVAINIT